MPKNVQATLRHATTASKRHTLRPVTVATSQDLKPDCSTPLAQHARAGMAHPISAQNMMSLPCNFTPSLPVPLTTFSKSVMTTSVSNVYNKPGS